MKEVCKRFESSTSVELSRLVQSGRTDPRELEQESPNLSRNNVEVREI